ncbi:MAG: energy transducer TonB [Bacteroidota bacterium]
MRRLVLLTALLASATSAQPADADTALVDQLLQGLRLDVSVEAMNALADSLDTEEPPLFGLNAGDFMRYDLGTVTDSIRASFFDDYQPDLVQEASKFLNGPIMDRVMRAVPIMAGAMGPQQMMALIETPGDRPLADSALTARYARALLSSYQQAELTNMTFDAMFEAISSAVPPEALKELDLQSARAALRSVDNEDMLDLQVSVSLPAFRITLGELDPSDIETSADFYESEAGRYAMFRTALGMMRIQIPQMVKAMVPMFARMAAREDLFETTPAPIPDGVLDFADVQPELLGGLASLQERVAYPPDAREEGVEGMVVIQFVVDEQGQVLDPVALRTPDDRLADAAIEAIVQSPFKPGQMDGKPVKVRFAVPVTFRLAD